MNRRRFLQSLVAVFTVPTGSVFSFQPAAAAASSAAAVPAQARFWAIYISALHGECTPQTLQNMLHIPEVDAKRYIGQLLADGVIRPTPILQRTVTELVKPKEDSLLDKVKKRLEKKQRASKVEAGVSEHLDATVEMEAHEAPDEVSEEELVEADAEDRETSFDVKITDLETDSRDKR